MNFIGTMPIETDRLILRRIREGDYRQAYKNWCSQEEVTSFVTWFIHKSEEETKKLFDAWIKAYDSPDTFRWIVELKDTNELIGSIDVVDEIEYGVCEIGYCYGKDYWGQGYGSEALKAVIKYLFDQAEADTICARFMIDNPASGAVMKKAGMTFEGVLRSRMVDKKGGRQDIGIYSITRDDHYGGGNL